MLQHSISILLLLSVAFYSQAEMADLSESELSDVTGEGIGLVYEDYQIEMLAESLNARDDGAGGTLTGGEAGNKFQITGIADAAGSAVNVDIAQYYFAGTGTELGTNLAGKTVNIGRLNNPISIDLRDGNSLGNASDGWADKSVLQIAMPTHVDASVGYNCTDAGALAGSGTCSSRPNDGSFRGERFDMGFRINRQFPSDPTKDINLNYHAQSANMDGSYWRFWGGSADIDGTGAGGVVQTLMMEVQMNFYASKLVFDSCELDGSACGEQVGFGEFSMELALGDAKYYQPMTIAVTDSGFLSIMIQPLPSPGDSRVPNSGTGTIGADGLQASSDATTWNWYNDYYENGRKTNITVSNLTVGAESFGSSSLQGLQIQHLEVLSHDL
ncbi:MAG: hypothetical protein ACI8SR_000794 [Oceanicoccus sp.]